MRRLRRREFIGGCAGLAAANISRAQTSSPQPFQFHWEPHYRERTPLDAVLAKRDAGLDSFLTEQYHDKIAAVFSTWRAALRNAQSLQVITDSFTTDFEGFSLHPALTTDVRSERALTVRRLQFDERETRVRAAFATELKQYLSDLPSILSADFQITRLDAFSDSRLETTVRYELVGTGDHFYREQRVGAWRLEWLRDPAMGRYRVRRWLPAAPEMRSRCPEPMYRDITTAAFGSNPSFQAQLAFGVDHWRTILDGACGIDIYGHNGVSVGDIDGNGSDDVYVCQPAGLPNRLFRNRGNRTFEDITEFAGVGVLDNTACALFADFENKGRQDLIVVRADGPLLFINDGNGKFRSRPDAFQFATPPQGTFTGAAVADYNCDGWLDIYFCLYVYYQGVNQYKYPAPYFDANNGPPNFLLRNARNGTFHDVTAASRLNQNNARFSFCCGWTDCDNDGWPDLYVVNDFGRKNLYRNNRDGTFTDIAEAGGAEDVGAGMSVCAFDYDNDGLEDLYVANMWTAAGQRISTQNAFRPQTSPPLRQLYEKHARGNSLLRNTGNNVFLNQTGTAGVGVGRWSWSSDTFDFDHDGHPDLYVTNGMLSGPLSEDLNSFFWRQVVAHSPDDDRPTAAYEAGWNAINDLIRSDYSWSGYERNVFYANNGDGTFSDVSGAIGLDFLDDARAFCCADFNGDGRQELLIKNRTGPQLRLLQNVRQELPPSISFRLTGTRSNRDAIGAAITIETGHTRQTRRLQAGSGFLSQHSKEIFFGLGGNNAPISALITWPGGAIQRLTDLPPNHRIHVDEGVESHRAEPFRTPVDLPHLSQPLPALPEHFETWLLAPVSAPEIFPAGDARSLGSLRGHPVLLHLHSAGALQPLPPAAPGLEFVAVNLQSPQWADVGAIYNILFRSLFDRHRDLAFPTSFLLDKNGQIVKLYVGPLDMERVAEDARAIPETAALRLANALPFPGEHQSFAYGRNYLSLGSAYFQRGYFEAAGAAFEVALRENALSAEAHYGLGSVALKQNDAASARTHFEQATKLATAYPETQPNAFNNLGLLAIEGGDADGAIARFNQALHLDPTHAVALQNLGNAYRQEKRWGEARDALERALTADPSSPEAHYSLGMVFAQTDRPAEANIHLTEALRLRPAYPEALNNLAILHLRTQHREEAVAEFTKCIAIAPAYDQAYLNLARVFAIEGDLTKARTVLEALLKIRPDDGAALQALSDLQ